MKTSNCTLQYGVLSSNNKLLPPLFFPTRNVKNVGRADVYIVVREGKKSLGSIKLPIEEQMCGGYSKEELQSGRVMKLEGKDANGSIRVLAKYSSYMSKPTAFKNPTHVGFAEAITWDKVQADTLCLIVFN